MDYRCGERAKFPDMAMGCDMPLDATTLYRCADCAVAFCSKCIREHFAKSTDPDRHFETRVALMAAERDIAALRADNARMAAVVEAAREVAATCRFCKKRGWFLYDHKQIACEVCGALRAALAALDAGRKGAT